MFFFYKSWEVARKSEKIWNRFQKNHVLQPNVDVMCVGLIHNYRIWMFSAQDFSKLMCICEKWTFHQNPIQFVSFLSVEEQMEWVLIVNSLRKIFRKKIVSAHFHNQRRINEPTKIGINSIPVIRWRYLIIEKKKHLKKLSILSSLIWMKKLYIHTIVSCCWRNFEIADNIYIHV